MIDSDTLLGVLVLALVVPLVIVAGYLVVRFRQARVTHAWQPVQELFEDARTSSGTGVASSYLQGRYRGRRFEAVSTPGVEVGSSSSDGGGPRFTLFELTLLDVPGRQSWQVVLHQRRAADGGGTWSLGSDDEPLAAGLRAAGVVDAVAGVVRADYTLAGPQPVLAYRARDTRLVLRSDADDRLVPSVAWVQRAMDLLLTVDATNSRLNPPHGDR